MNIQPKLISDCIKKDRKAEYELYKNTYSYLMSICLRYTRDKERATEVLNIGFLKILNNLEKYNLAIPFKVWIRKIMVNTLIDEYRKLKRESERITYVEEYYDSVNYSEANDAIARLDYKQIYDLISELPESTKQVFNLFVIDGYSHNEIAEMMGISEGTSKWHLNTARTKLKVLIEKNIITTTLVR